MTYNRPGYIMRSINSVLAQTYHDFNLIVSDNSTNDETKHIIEKANIEDSRFIYKKREKTLPGIVHFNTIHEEASSQYYMIFHDDDEMLPNMVEELYKAIRENNDIVAVGAYAYIVKYRKQIAPKIPQFKEILNTPIAIIEKYSSGRSNASFPSYMYNKKLLKQRQLWKNGGKYSDCSFIVSLTMDGIVVHVSQLLMKTTIHGEQDSQDHQFSQYLTLIKYLRNIIGKKDIDKIAYMRVFNIYNEWVLRNKEKKTPYYNKRLYFLFLKYSSTNFFPKYIIRKLRLYNK